MPDDRSNSPLINVVSSANETEQPSTGAQEDSTYSQHPQKRPRLDSGSRSKRSISADPQANGADSPHSPRSLHSLDSPSTMVSTSDLPTSSQIRPSSTVTLNVRPAASSNGQQSHSPPGTPPNEQIDIRASIEPVPSSPDIPIEIADLEPQSNDETDDIHEIHEIHDIQVEGEDDFVETLMASFPYSNNQIRPAKAASNILRHIEQQADVDVIILYSLADWLKSAHDCLSSPQNKRYWGQVFHENFELWEFLAQIVCQFLSKDIPILQPQEEPRLQHTAVSFLQSYLGLSSRILALDTNNLIRDNLKKPPMAKNSLIAVRAILWPNSAFLVKSLIESRHLEPSLRSQLARNFLVNTDAGLKGLCKYTSVVVERYHDNQAFQEGAAAGLGLLPVIMAAAHLDYPDSRIVASRLDHANVLLKTFNELDARLKIEVAHDKDANVEFRRCMPVHGVDILTQAMVLNEDIALSKFKDIVGTDTQVPQSSYPSVITTVWKIKLMKQYICKGRMESRCHSADTMSTELVAFFNEFSTTDSSNIRRSFVPPEFKCIADVLIEEKLMEYIVSPESHPQIISRSGNILGFLVITNNFTAERIDLVWNTLVNSPDHRMTAAIVQALAHVLKILTDLTEDLYICKKLTETPIPTFDQSTVALVDCILHKLRSKLSAQPIFTWSDEETLTFVQTCISIMIQAANSKPQTQYHERVSEDATRSLTSINSHLTLSLRRRIYAHCASFMNQVSISESIYARTLYIILLAHKDDIESVTEDLDITNLAIKSFSSSIGIYNNERNDTDTSNWTDFFKWKTELILLLLDVSPSSATLGSCKTFWNHLLGEEAVIDGLRDFGWNSLSKLIENNSTTNALNSLYDHFIPSLEPDCIPKSCVTFLEKFARIKLAEAAPLKCGADKVLTLPGIDLMWRIMLIAPDKSGAEVATTFLASIWIDPILVNLTEQSLEVNHRAIVKICLDHMNKSFDAAESLKSQERSSSSHNDNQKLHRQLLIEEQISDRIVDFLKALMIVIRAHPEVSLSPSPTESPVLSNSSIVNGKQITLKYQIHPVSVRAGPISELTVGDLETKKELYERIQHITGFSLFKIIWGGAPIDLMDKPMETLRDFKAENKTLMIVREVTNSNAPSAPRSKKINRQQKSFFDQEMVSNFETLYKFLGSSNRAASSVYELLLEYPPHESVCIKASSSDIDNEVLFPSLSRCQTHYSLRALHHVYLQKHKEEVFDHGFFVQTSHRLEWLMSRDDLSIQVNDIEALLKIVTHTAELLLAIFHKLDRFSEECEVLLENGGLFMERLIEIIQILVKLPEKVDSVQDLFELILQVGFHTELGWVAYSDSKLSDLHEQLLLATPSTKLRGNISSTLITMMTRFRDRPHLTCKNFVNFYWEIISTLIKQSAIWSSQARDFYILAETFFDQRFSNINDSQAESDRLILSDYWTEWTGILLNYQTSEFVGREEVVYIIAGLSVLLRMIFGCIGNMEPMLPLRPNIETLSKDIWAKLLFPCTEVYSDQQRMPLLDSKTRKNVYDLLATITIKQSISGLKNVANWIDKESTTKYLSDQPRQMVERIRLIRGETGHLGLRNLGNTCYMNSLLTQLYMNPAFRSFMINQSIHIPQNQILLEETQNLFCRMQNGYGPCGDPGAVARSIKTYFEESINVAEQMDVEEFFNLLFDQWENHLSSAEEKDGFRSFYAGKLVNQIKSKECEHVSENEERYLNLQCDVQGKTNLIDSLQALVEGDVMQGDNKYKCEKCGGKLVEAVRRARLKEIPDHLILHLKRFEYDIGLQRRSKINDYFEFPYSIDMNPYTINHLIEDESSKAPDMFELVGVLVHKGQAEHGHYISYIRDRPNENGSHQPSWYLFDDSEVTHFDYRNLGDHCYGGPIAKDGMYSTNLMSSVKVYSAYMLFYERSSSIERLRSGNASIPQEMSLKIQDENAEALHQYCLFGEPHMEFVRELMIEMEDLDHSLEQHGTQKAIISAALNHIWKVAGRCKDFPDYTDKLDLLIQIASRCAHCGLLMIGWLAVNVPKTRDMLFRFTNARARQPFQTFYLTILRQLRGGPCYGIDISSDSLPDETDSNGALFLTLNTFWEIVNLELHYNAKGFDEFFAMCYKIASWGDLEALTMILQGFFTTCLNFLIMHSDNHLYSKYSKLVGLMERRQVSYRHLALFWDVLLRYVDLQTVAEYDQPRTVLHGDEVPQISALSNEYDILRHWSSGHLIWMVRLFEKWDPHREAKEPIPEHIIGTIISFDEDQLYTPKIVQCLAQMIIKLTPIDADTYIRASFAILKHARNLHHVENIASAVGQVVMNVNDVGNGQLLLDFFDRLRTINNPYLVCPEPGLPSFYYTSLQFASQFAPALLSWQEDAMVRYQAHALFHDLLLQMPIVADEEPTEFERFRIQQIRLIARKCLNRANEFLQEVMSKTFLQPLMTTLKDLVRIIASLEESPRTASLWEARDQELVDRFPLTQTAFEAAPPEEDDEEVAQSTVSDGTDGSDEDMETGDI